MKNKKRHSDFINLKQKIESCTVARKLESMREVVLKFRQGNNGEGNDLVVLFLQKRWELDPNYIYDLLSNH